MRHPRFCFVLAITATTALLAGGSAFLRAAADSDPTWTIEAVSSPAGAESSAPDLTSNGDRTIISWMERAGSRASLKFAERTASGWSAARMVVSGADLLVNAADVPSVRVLEGGTLVAHWMQSNSPDPEAYDLRIAWSKDGGATWSPAVSPHHDGTKTQHGFASLFQAPGAGLGLVWLDGRATDPDAPNATGNMSLRSATFSREGKQLRDAALDTRVCECCETSVAATSEGPIVAYRNRSTKEVRDIYVSRLSGGRWTTPVAVHHDNWEIDACPVNGPAISARARDVVVAWFAAPKEDGHAFVAFSKDGGRTFGSPLRIDDKSSTGHLDVELLSDGSAAVSWIEFADERSQFKIRRIEPGGDKSAAVTVGSAGQGRVAGTPKLTKGRNELLLAWTETANGASRVQTARVALPAAAGEKR
jgi:hypothetical protein